MFIGSFMSTFWFSRMVFSFSVTTGSEKDLIINSVELFNAGYWETIAVLSKKKHCLKYSIIFNNLCL